MKRDNARVYVILKTIILQSIVVDNQIERNEFPE